MITWGVLAEGRGEIWLRSVYCGPDAYYECQEPDTRPLHRSPGALDTPTGLETIWLLALV